MSAPVKNEKGCWYFILIAECPVCGRGSTTRVRSEGPRPEDARERYAFEQVYDWCDYDWCDAL